MKLVSRLRAFYDRIGAALAFGLFFLLPAVVMAEGESSQAPTPDWSFTDAGNAVNSMSSNLVTFLTTKVIPAVLAVIAAAAALLLLYKIVRWIFKALFTR